MKRCWNCGTDIDTRDKTYYTDLIAKYRERIIGSMDKTEEWDQGFLDALKVAQEIIKDS